MVLKECTAYDVFGSVNGGAKWFCSLVVCFYMKHKLNAKHYEIRLPHNFKTTFYILSGCVDQGNVGLFVSDQDTISKVVNWCHVGEALISILRRSTTAHI